MSPMDTLLEVGIDLPVKIQEIYDQCNDEEKSILVQILMELSQTGESQTYKDLWYQDYKEIPVDLDTFLCDDRYLGKVTRNGEGIYPYWKTAMHQIFDAGNKYHECLFTGATRIGKSSTAITCTAYMLYRLMCLRDPQKFFNKKEESKFCIMFFNLTKDLARGVAFREFNDTLAASPWFMEHGTLSRSERDFYYIPEGGKVVVDYGSDVAHSLGLQIYVGVMDEINFARSGIKDINKAKANIKATYDSVVARVEGTFRQNGEVWGKIFAVSSKKSDSDFMEDHIQQQMSAGNEHMIVFDKPQWEVLPPGQFNPERFYIAIGDRHHRGFVVQNDSEEALSELREQGYQLMQVPLDMKTNFLADFDVSLRDLAGIAVPGALSFISQDILDANIVQDRHNPFLNEILEIGTKDSYTIEEFFHSELVPKYIKSMDMFIHLDLSLNDDKSGISGVGIIGRKDIKQDDGKVISMPMFGHAFSVDIKAPRGDKIPYAKITNFIVWLRSQGFNIELVSRDQFQSEYMAQLLEAQGFRTEKISLDRTPDGYMALRSILLEQRIEMLDVKYLQDELIYLQRDSLTGKVDHMVGRCFTGDTKIKVVGQKSKSILQLLQEYNAGADIHLYSYDTSARAIVVQKVKRVFKTMSTTRLVEVELDSGELVRCTPYHRFMLADGTYKPIKDIGYHEDLMGMSLIKGIRRIKFIRCDDPVPVYDIEMESIPNFALNSGVFVHNSKDMADSFAGATWCAMKFGGGTPVDRVNVMKAVAAVNGPRNNLARDASHLPSMFPGLNFNKGSRRK